jgi:hypothetical protein
VLLVRAVSSSTAPKCGAGGDGETGMSASFGALTAKVR